MANGMRFGLFVLILMAGFALCECQTPPSTHVDAPVSPKKSPTVELLRNGDFSSGNAEFESGYAYSETSIVPTGTYSITSNPALIHPSATAMVDHTTGTGLMGVWNGSTVADIVAWQETVSVVPNTSYLFSGWISTFDKSGTFNQFDIDIHPADLRFVINGTEVGTFSLVGPAEDGAWGQFKFVWISGSAATATIQIFIVRTDDSGNDVAIDDLSFIGPYYR